MPVVQRTSQAELDRVEIALRIARDNPAAADRLLETVDENAICLPECRKWDANVLIWRQICEARSLPVGDYVIFYRPVPDGIQVIRVLHGARDIPTLFD